MACRWGSRCAGPATARALHKHGVYRTRPGEKSDVVLPACVQALPADHRQAQRGLGSVRARCRGCRRACCCLNTRHAYLHSSSSACPTLRARRARSAPCSPGLRVAMVDASEALKQVQDWGGAPANSKFVCSTCKSDAGAMAEFFSEVSSGQKGAAEPMIFVAPNCRSATDTKAMQRLVEHLKRSCDSANVQYLEGAPQPALSMLPQVSAPEPQTDLTQEEVMGTVLDWFQSMLVTLTDEEDFIEIGRILLSVKKYTVNNAVSPERFQAGFWAEVAKLVEAGEDGNSMMVAPNFMLDDLQGFEAFVHRQVPLFPRAVSL